MLACHAPTRISIRTLLTNVFDLPSTTGLVGRLPSRQKNSCLRQYHATVPLARDELALQGQQVYPDKRITRRSVTVGKSGQFLRADLEQEARYLRDPVKLAGSTLGLLRRDEHDKALEIVRIASRTTACVVSWNHLIDYHVTKGRVAESLKIYNEMKKRGEPPDARTYTMLFRGLAQQIDYPLSLSRALSIYQSMFAENSPVRPSIIHTNAVLQVCAKAKDMDSLFGIAAKLPTKGNDAPDHQTFTTILNAIKTQAVLDNLSVRDETSEAKEARRQEAVLRGRRIWGDIIERWRKSDIWIDEALVCSMGRLLLLGSRTNDDDDVLSLVEQTMDIPRQIPRLGDPTRTSHLTSIQFGNPGTSDLTSVETRQPSQEVDDPELSSSSQPLLSQSTEFGTPSPGSEFDPLPPSIRTVCSVAQPGRNTLSLLMEACMRMRAPHSANAYRSLLTSLTGPYKVTPDTENLHMYLRLLRQTRSSRNAVGLVNEMLSNPPVGAGVQAKTFRIAMSACARDIKNPVVGETATRLLKMMEQKLDEPDLMTCRMYLEIMGRDTKESWKELFKGLTEMKDVTRNWRSLLAYGRFTDNETNADEWDDEDVESDRPAKRQRRLALRTRPDSSSGAIDKQSRTLIKQFFAKMVSAYDKLLHRAGENISREDRRKCKRHQGELAGWITRQNNYNTTLKRKMTQPELDGGAEVSLYREKTGSGSRTGTGTGSGSRARNRIGYHQHET